MPSNSLTAEEQFLAYHNKLRNEVDTAYTHYEIAKILREFSSTRHADFIEAQTFFQVTIDANLFSAVVTIYRGFIDKRNDCLQMDGFFELIKQNLGLFSTAAFKERKALKGMDQEDLEYWASKHVEITTTIVDDDEEKVKSLPISNLISWRHKKLVHIDKTQALNNTDIMETNPITVKEIDDIIITLNDILNRYSISYGDAEYVIGLPPTKYQIDYIMDALSFFRESRNK